MLVRATVLGGVLAMTVLGTGLGTAGVAAADEPDPGTRSSTTRARADGTRVVTLHSGPVELRRGTEWVPVDLTLRSEPDGVVRPVAAPHDLALTPTGPVVRYSGGGSDALAAVIPDALPIAGLAGNTATYTQVAPGWDLVVEATRAGFAASIRHTAAGIDAGTDAAGPAPALALLANPESLAESVGTAVGAAAGGTAAGGTAAGESVATGVAGATESAVSRVVAAAPAAGPTPVPFDTTVQSTVLRTDLSGDPDLRVGSYDGVAVARSYLAWDLTQVAGAQVTSAVLRMHQYWSSSCRAAGWEVWSSGAVGPATRWAGQPAVDGPDGRAWATSTDTRGNSPACAPGWSEVDVTDLVRAWAASGAPSGTMQLRASDEADTLGWKRFGSAEGPDVPQLVITLG